MSSSYTYKEVEKLHEVYNDNPCLETVARLSVLLNRPKKSIISKLVKEGIYITKGYVTKLGETPITKLQIVRSIEGYTDISLPGLDKTPKTTLKLLVDAVEDLSVHLEEALGSLSDCMEIQSVREEMRAKKINRDEFSILKL